MASRIVHKPEVQQHRCKPGWTVRVLEEDGGLPFFLPKGTRLLDPPKSWDYPAGVVVECDCGKTYVSCGTPIPNWPGCVVFRLEGRIERWRRERKQRRG